MSHHGPFPPPNLGATGNFPKGKLTEDDEGELRLAIAGNPKTKKVIMHFGKNINWIGFEPHQARDIANMLNEHADIAEGKAK